MGTCVWCTAENDEVATATLRLYCTGKMSPQEMQSANDYLSYCGDCVEKYHTVRGRVPELHKCLWELETGRLIEECRKFLEVKLDDADVYVVDNGKEQPVLEFSPENLITSLRFPLMEILKFPYLLCHKDLCEMVVKVIHKMQCMDIPLSVTDKYQGIYLLMVHPNEMVRRWAMTTARSLGRVDRDSYFNLEEIFSCMFFVIELGISLDCPVSDDELCAGKIQRLPSHLYDSKDEKNYWLGSYGDRLRKAFWNSHIISWVLGICMLLMQLDSRAMDSLFLGPEKHANILQCIMNTMADCGGDEDKASDPFWPALQCFMVILDRLGSKIWSQIEPVDAFSAVTRAASYADEIRNIREKTEGTRVKLEKESDDDDDMVSCSQMVYDCYSAERGNRWSGWSLDTRESNSAIIYEEMSCLVTILQSEMGQDMHVYGSTFLWFIPFVRSVMDLAEVGIVFVVIHYLYDEINQDVLSGRAHTCDKVTEFFVRILVIIIELHLNQDCMKMLYSCIHEWVTVVVLSSTLSNETCVRSVGDRKGGSHRVTSTSSRAPVAGVGAMSRACIKLVLALLKKGRRMGINSNSTHFLDLLNMHLHEDRGWNPTKSECDSLHNCLVQLVKAISDDSAASPVLPTPPEDAPGTSASSFPSLHPLQEPRCKDAETGTRDRFDAIKEEPHLEYGEHDVCDFVDENVAKLEPRSPVLISELKLELKPDLGKIHEIRSRLNNNQSISKIQAIATRKSESGQGLNGCSGLKNAGRTSEISHTATLKPTTPGLSMLREHSKNDWNEDELLNVQRGCQKRSLAGWSSDSGDDACDTRNMSVQPSSSSNSCIIVISDDEVDVSEDKLMGGDCPHDGAGNAKLKSSLDPALNESPGRDYDDLSESQVFEFETQKYVASAWGDLSFEGPVVTKKRKLDPMSEANNSRGDVEPGSDWDNETQPVLDEDIEKACLQVEEIIRKQQQVQEPSASSTMVASKPSNSPEKWDNFIQPKPVIPSKSPSKKPAGADKVKQCQHKKTVLIEPLSQKPNRRSHTTSAQESEKLPSIKTPFSESPFASASSISSSVSSVECRLSTPAIIPPKKVRKHVEPESVAERLGLKKRERKAFDLSQRSLDSLGELRSHGQHVHVQTQQKSRRTRIVRKPRQKLPRKGRKKLLASQDMQYFRQSRGTHQKSTPTSTVPPKPAKRPMPKEKSNPTCASGSTEEPALREDDDDDDDDEEEEEDDYYFLPCSQSDLDRETVSKKAAKRVGIGVPGEVDKSRSEQIANHECEESAQISKSTDVSASSAAERAETREESGSDDDREWRCLTQNEATDMELCSQMDQAEYEEAFFHTQRDLVDMDIDADDEPQTSSDATGGSPATLSTSMSEKAPFAAPTWNSLNSNLNLTAGSPSTQKKAKPCTTKIYAPVSRSASLVMEMEKASKPLPVATVAKAKAPPLPPPSKVPPAPQPLPKRLIPPKNPRGFTKPVAYRPTLPLPNHVLKSTVPPPNNTSWTSQPRSYNAHPRPQPPASVSASTMDQAQTYDKTYLTQAVLKWEYRIFDNYKTFGAPDDLHCLPLKKVPMTFSNYPEYFNILFPLLLVNAFEEMASEWHSGRRIKLQLKVQGIEYSNRIASASFIASLSPQQDMKQLYPKEEDLVFLWLPENTGAYANDELHEPRPYLGFVSRSMVYSNGGGQPSTLNLTIQTCGNVSSVNAQLVPCSVIGSLVSTLREFRALCLLRHGMMKQILLTPHARNFTPTVTACPHNPLLNENGEDEYNEDQEKAIACGVAMVKRSQKPPKILLIHGPPGTGKSRTIVGLLCKLLYDDRARTSVNRQGRPCRMRVLVCAPSNAAIDNLMKKMIVNFKEKSTVPQGNCGDINLVRLGNEKTISQALHAFSLESQTKARTLKAQQKSDSDKLRQKEELDQSIDSLSQACAKTRKNSPEMAALMARKACYLKDREKLVRQIRENRSKRQEVQALILREANVICSTLSTSGSVVLESAFRQLGHEPFSCVIIDEAGQAKETETLIPFLHRCPSLILVGDPEQLPPTVVSQKAKELGYDQSLMARLMKSLHQSNPQPAPSIFFSVQYRMHPDICQFPSKYIYHKRLKTDCKVAQKRHSQSWPFEPYLVFDVIDGRERREGDSFFNLKEVQLVQQLVRLMGEKQMVRVGVITPYNAQKHRIQEALKEVCHSSKLPQVDVNTVDGFQGRDMDCIIVSCVRASSEMGSIGFVGNRQRMNVTITRAKFSLFILGHLRTLREQTDWHALIEDAARRDAIRKTQERDFPSAVGNILKRDLLSRSASYPPTGGHTPVCAEDPAPTHVEAVAARVSHTKRSSEQSSGRSPTVSSSTGGALRRASPPPPHTELPRDPRLYLRVSDSRPLEVQPVRELDPERRDPRQPIREQDRKRRRTQHLTHRKEQTDWHAVRDDAAQRGAIIKPHDFPSASGNILKQDLLSRSTSYPPTGGLAPICAEDPALTHVDAVAARVSHTKRSSEQSSGRSPTVSSSTGGALRRASPPPPHTELPRDPRLYLRVSDSRTLEVQPVRELDPERRDLRQPIREPDPERRGTREPRQQVHAEVHHRTNQPRAHSAQRQPSRTHRR